MLVRCPTATRDVAQAVRFLVGRGEPGVWHASAPFAGTRYELTCEVARQLGLAAAHLTPSREVIPRAARRPVDASLDSTRLRSAGFNGLRGLPDMLRDFL
ncbi:MAG: sugar nucleotide-binding protein [Kiritimatiellia bacterium]